MKIKYIGIIILISTLSTFAKIIDTNPTVLKYKNIIILSDLSSRLRNQKPKDIEAINKILSYFRNQCVQPGQKIGDKSSIYFSVFSDNTPNSNNHIDLDEIKDLGQKQSFVNSKGPFLNKGLDYKIDLLKKSILNLYSNTKNPGLDLISQLAEKIQNEKGILIKENKNISAGNNSKSFHFENHIFLFTDGYLEFQTKNASPEFYFGKFQIQKLRNYCFANHIDIKTALHNSQSLGIPKVFNPKNRLINLHILETHERDKDIKTQTYKNPLGFRDNEILEAVWRKWAQDSGFKSFEWRKY